MKALQQKIAELPVDRQQAIKQRYQELLTTYLKQMETDFIAELIALLQKYPDVKLGEIVVKAVSPSHRKTLEPYFQNYLFEADNSIVVEGLNSLLTEDTP